VRFATLGDRDRRALVLGAAVLLPALLWAAVVKPYRAALDELRERTAAEQSLLQRERTLLDGADVNALVRDMEERARQASLRLVSAPNAPLAEAEVTAFLQELAKLSRVLLQELRGVEDRRARGGAGGSAAGGGAAASAAAPDAAALRVIRLAVRGESDLEGVLTFLQRIENSPLLMRVTELSIEPHREGRDGARRTDGAVTFSLQLDAFANAEAVP
jgi:hypothetical protein